MTYLTINGYKAGDGGPVGEGDDKFTAQVNPSSISVKYGVDYTQEMDNMGKIIPQKVFKGCRTQTVSFELLLDNTGVLPDNPSAKGSVNDQIEQFKKTCYYYKGNKHETPYVKIHWNDTSFFKYNNQAFYGRVESFDVNYTMFSSKGEPIRATINATFGGTLDPETESNLKDNQSPDLTHVITVKAGDNLPMLCEKIYGKRQMFQEVARANNLISFRELEPGTELVFPPIK